MHPALPCVAALLSFQGHMETKRLMLQTDGQGRLKSVPALPPDSKIEAIFLVLEPTSGNAVRQPPPELAGIKVLGDVVAPAIAPDDWVFTKIILDTTHGCGGCPAPRARCRLFSPTMSRTWSRSARMKASRRSTL